MNRAYIRDFVIKQRCLPYTVVLWLKRRLPRVYLLLFYGSFDANAGRRWDRIWGDEGQETWRTYPRRFEAIARLLDGESGAIVDIGCGVGVLLKYLKETIPSRDMTGVDISRVAIEQVRGLGFKGVVARLPELPLDSEAYDVALAGEVLEHLRRPEKAVEQFARVLKPSGRLIVTVPDDRLSFLEEDQHFHSFDEQSLRSILAPYFDVRSLEVVKDEWTDRTGLRRSDSSFVALAVKKATCP